MTTLAPTPATQRTAPALGGLNPTILRIELRRMLRNKRTVIFTFLLPVVFFLMFGPGQDYSDQRAGSGNLTAYIMVSMAVYGAMLATTSGGAMVSVERAAGWSRQLRLTPLQPVAYVALKMLVALTLGLGSVVSVYVAGALRGADLPASAWIATALIAWIGSLAFAAFGLFMGYLLPSENVMQVLGPVLAVLAFLGGLFVPLDQLSPVFQALAKLTPMYGLNTLVHAPIVGWSDAAAATLNLLAWSTVFVAGAAWRFRRDTARV